MRNAVIAAQWTVGLLVGMASSQSYAQVVQLPTFESFSVSTTVLVPDRGSMMLGGVDRAAFGAAAFGVPGVAGVPGAGRLFGNRAIGGQVQSSRVNAAASIIDLQELDRSVRGQPAAPAPQTNPAIARKAAFLAQHIARNEKAPAVSPITVADKHATDKPQAIAKLPDAETEARNAYRLAEQAEAQGQLATARINYKRAASLSRGKFRSDALARLAAITPAKDSQTPIR
jgi:hypothetical protein